MNNQVLWEKFARGDRLTLNELDLLISEIDSAIPYLENRTSHVGEAVLSGTVITLGQLHQLKKIESWFEFYGDGQCSQAWADLTPIDRMRLIMQNIVDNNGTFIPSRLPREYQNRS